MKALSQPYLFPFVLLQLEGRPKSFLMYCSWAGFAVQRCVHAQRRGCIFFSPVTGRAAILVLFGMKRLEGGFPPDLHKLVKLHVLLKGSGSASPQ